MLANLPPEFASDFMDEGVASRGKPGHVAICLDLISNRKLVGVHIGFELCADPVWVMLLDLYVWEHRGRDIAISSLASAANVPATRARASMRTLHDLGWVYRHPDAEDGRRIYIRLTDKAHALSPPFSTGLLAEPAIQTRVQKVGEGGGSLGIYRPGVRDVFLPNASWQRSGRSTGGEHQSGSHAGTDLEALVRDVRSALRAPAIRHFHKRYERDKAALTRRIDAYLDRSGPTPFGKALATLARQFDGAD